MTDPAIFAQVDGYIAGLLAPEDEALHYATAGILAAGYPDASISPVQGKLLQVLAAACQARRILELGTFGAYSTIWLAGALPEDGRLITLECDAAFAALAQHNVNHAGLGHKVEIRQGIALHLLQTMIDGGEAPFDLFFIDADKPPYTEYFRMALQLARPGSIIICDNVIRNGNVLDPASEDEKVQGVRRLNAFLADCREVTATILQVVGSKEYDGMVVAVVNP